MDIIEMSQAIYDFLMAVGVDIVVVISIVVIAQACKKEFKWKSKTSFIVILCAGVLCGLLKIIFVQVEVSQYMTTLFGYPGISVLLYMAFKFFMPKLKEKVFPSSKQIDKK